MDVSQKMKPLNLIILCLSLLYPASATYGYLGASLQQCEAEYGKVQHTDTMNGKTVRGFLVPIGVLKNTIVFAIFNQEGRVEEIKYKGRGKDKFTSLQFSVILGCSTPDEKKPFIETGVTPDKSKRMWARADYSAYVVSEESTPAVTVLSKEAAISFFKSFDKK